MEFTLDLGLLRRIIDQEYAATSGEIRTAGVLYALESSQPRHDGRIASAADIDTLACRAGCTWCCYFTVDVRAAEVFRILDYIERTFTPEETARVHDEIRANSNEVQKLSDGERAIRNVKCPFLTEGRCSIYVARPQTCRNYHATNVAGCQRAYEEPGNSEIDPEFAPGVYQAGAAHVDAVSAAISDAGYDTCVYELSSALDAALSQPGARGLFEAGLPPFIGLDGEPVPAEFDDLVAQVSR